MALGKDTTSEKEKTMDTKSKAMGETSLLEISNGRKLIGWETKTSTGGFEAD